MFSVLAIAANGMATQAERVEAAAQSVASQGVTAPAERSQDTTSTVRVSALPMGGTMEESMVTLVDAQNAYRMNAVVFATADALLGTLLDTLGTDGKDCA